MNKLDIFLQMSKERPEDPQVLYMLANAYIEENMIKEARNTLYDAVIFADDNFRVVLMQTIKDLDDKKTGKASANDAPIVSDISINDIITNKIPTKRQITFADVGGLDNIKEAINLKIIQPFLHPELFSKFNKVAGGGMLLYGPPGCGKTFIAKATAGECNASFINMNITDIMDKYYGNSEKNIENLFIRARSSTPCIVFIDEIDMLGYSRSKDRDSSTMRGVVDQLLSEMEGINSNNEGILVIAATNMPWDVDTALKRPGRFDKVIFVPPPDLDSRKMIFESQFKDKPCDNLDYNMLAQQTELFSGADISGIAELATEQVLKEILQSGDSNRKITQKDVLNAIANTRCSTKEWLRIISDYVKYSNQTGQYSDVEEYLNKFKGFI